MSGLSVYIHIPFCVRKCRYCDFLSVPVCRSDLPGSLIRDPDLSLISAYFEALSAEIRSAGPKLCKHVITTVYFGGGTPSLVPSVYIKNILGLLRDSADFAEDAEISMEMNPGTLREESIPDYLEGGVNRVSIGLQSVHERELSALGRIHSFQDFCRTFGLLRSAGFENLNVDLMTGIPFETKGSAKETLETAVSLKPSHLSVYSLILEPGTPLFEAYEASPESLCLPDEDTVLEIDGFTREYLEEQGYHRYEISNYAREGYACRHNLRTWDCRDYLGFGAGAASLYEGRRRTNVRDLKRYMSSPGRAAEEDKILTEQEKMEEFMFLGLRKTEGVSLSDFRERFGRELAEVYGEAAAKHRARGLLSLSAERLFLTARGLDLSNQILSDFLL